MTGALDDTICGIATPLGEGGVGIVRLSGRHSIQIAGTLAKLRSGYRWPRREIIPFTLQTYPSRPRIRQLSQRFQAGDCGG